MQTYKAALYVVVLGVATLGSQANAKIIEEFVKVPMTVKNEYGKEVSQDVVITTFYDDSTPSPRPVAIIGHGRPPSGEQRLAMTRQRYSGNSAWFAKLGFLVAVPTRIGYGPEATEDVEDSGGCRNKVYPPGYDAAAVQELRTLELMRARADTLKDRAIVVGQSYGGATAIAVAGKNPDGVQMAINFAGGGGGNPETQPGNPCAPQRLEAMFGSYGKTAKMPTLWLYTENDLFMGPKFPKEWFAAFKDAGGKGEFLFFPPVGKDGHSMFTSSPSMWRGKVLDFMKANGYPNLPSID